MLWYVLHSILCMHADIHTYNISTHLCKIIPCPCPGHLAICSDLARCETGDLSVEAEIGKKGGVHGWARDYTVYGMSTSHCRNRRRLLVLVWPIDVNTTRMYPYKTLNLHSVTPLARPAAHSTAFILPCRQKLSGYVAVLIRAW